MVNFVAQIPIQRHAPIVTAPAANALQPAKRNVHHAIPESSRYKSTIFALRTVMRIAASAKSQVIALLENIACFTRIVQSASHVRRVAPIVQIPALINVPRVRLDINSLTKVGLEILGQLRPVRVL